MMIDLL